MRGRSAQRSRRDAGSPVSSICSQCCHRQVMPGLLLGMGVPSTVPRAGCVGRQPFPTSTCDVPLTCVIRCGGVLGTAWDRLALPLGGPVSWFHPSLLGEGPRGFVGQTLQHQ